MGTVILGKALRHKYLRPSRLVPAWGVKKAAEQASLLGLTKIIVGKRGLFYDKRNDKGEVVREKVSWSRLTSYHLKKLGIDTIYLDNPKDAKLLLPLAVKTKNSSDLNFPEAEIFAVERASSASYSLDQVDHQVRPFLSPIKDPSFPVSFIYRLTHWERLSDGAITQLLDAIEAKGPFNLLKLGPRAAMLGVQKVADRATLEAFLNCGEGEPSAKHLAMQRLRSLYPANYLINLSAEAIATYADLEALSEVRAQNPAAAGTVLGRLFGQELVADIDEKPSACAATTLKLFALGEDLDFGNISALAVAMMINTAGLGRPHPELTPLQQRMATFLVLHQAELVEKLSAGLQDITEHGAEDAGFIFNRAFAALGKEKEPAIEALINAFMAAREERVRAAMDASAAESGQYQDDPAYDPKYNSSHQ